MRKLPCSMVAALLVAGCFSSDPAPVKPSGEPSAKAPAPPPSSATPGALAAAPASATARAAAAPIDQGPPVCARSNEKVWGSGANKLTGLTTKRVDKKLAIGFAFGIEPRVLAIDPNGEAKVFKVKTGAKATPPEPKDGYRALMRVSPLAIEGETARAFIDYRDEYKDKRRRVACGPADADDNFLAFDGTSWLDLDPKPAGDEKKKLFSWKKQGGYVELRDCRTFVTLGSNEVWALGSILRGIEKPDGTHEWKVVFLVDFGKNDEEIVLHEAPLKGDPPKLVTYEIPTSRRVKDKGFVIATRFGGSLMVGVLDMTRKLKGGFKTYRGFPSMPDIGTTEEELILMTGVGGGKEKSLKALLIPRESLELPASYTDVPLASMDASGDAEAAFTAPELTVDSKGQRWLGYVEGSRDKGYLRLVPVDKDLKPAGRAFSVTEGDVFASEGRVVALGNGRLMIVYLREKEKKIELVTEELSCEVKK